jgi:hypothetical protein
MNTAVIDNAGLAPLKPELDAVDAIKTRADLARVLGAACAPTSTGSTMPTSTPGTCSACS